MPSQPVSAHITVVQRAPASPARGAAAETPAADAGDFSRLLARQLDSQDQSLVIADKAPETPAMTADLVEQGNAPSQTTNALALPLVMPPGGGVPDRPAREAGPAAGGGEARNPPLALSAAALPGNAPGLTANIAGAPLRVPGDASRVGDAAATREIQAETPATDVRPHLPVSPAPGAEPGAPAAAPVLSAVHAPVSRNDAVGAAQTPGPAQGLAAVQTPVGASGWGAEFAQKVAWLAHNGQQLAHISVNPPQLGPVEIRLSLSQDQASMTFVTPHAPVREAIEAALHRLREMFAESGINLGNVDVAAHSFGQGRPQDGQTHTAQAQPRAAAADAGSSPGTWALPALPLREGMVDVFA